MRVILHRAWGPATFISLVVGIATLWTLPSRMTANERLDSVQDGKLEAITQYGSWPLKSHVDIDDERDAEIRTRLKALEEQMRKLDAMQVDLSWIREQLKQHILKP